MRDPVCVHGWRAGCHTSQPGLASGQEMSEPKVKVKSLSRARLFATPWTVACTKLLRPWDFQGKKYWSGLPFPSPGDLPDPGIEPGSPSLQADSLPLNHSESPLLGAFNFDFFIN